MLSNEGKNVKIINIGSAAVILIFQIIGDRLAVGHQVLALATGVRIPLSEPEETQSNIYINQKDKQTIVKIYGKSKAGKNAVFSN